MSTDSMVLAALRSDLIKVGDRIRFKPQNSGRNWWTVRARDERFIIATQQAAFHPKGTIYYTVVDLTGWSDRRYNGAGHGVVRSSLDTLGGGYDLGPDGQGCDQMLAELNDGTSELSVRRVVNVWDVERRAA